MRETDLAVQVRSILERHSQPDFGWTVPNAATYPWLWLWDSCFHALIWDALGDSRAVTELAGIFAAQTANGFLPHMNYAADPTASELFWGVSGASTLTQPPLYGHALMVLRQHGWSIDSLIEPALAAMSHLLEARRAPCGLLRIYHPWESGIDDNPRWEAWQPTPWTRRGWGDIKSRLVQALVVEAGEATSSREFDVCPAGFNALVAWNARQLAAVSNENNLRRRADELVLLLDSCWDEALETWVDVGPCGKRSSSVRTLDGLLPALVTSFPDRAKRAIELALDPAAFGLAYGPSGVHIEEPAFCASGYGRGASWPNLTYLLWVASKERGEHETAVELARLLVEGARMSGMAEYWDSRTGTGLGARPQSWTGLALVVALSNGSHGASPVE